MQSELIIEIGFEELPAIPLIKELDNIPQKFKNSFNFFRIDFDFDFFYTPRRFVFHTKNFPSKQDDEVVEMFGPPLEAAYKDGVPTGAALGFSKKCGVELDSLDSADKNGKKVLYFKTLKSGSSSFDFLSTALKNFLDSLSFGRSMRWGAREESFIRPIKWLLVMGEEGGLDVTLYDVKSSPYTLGHMSDVGKRLGVKDCNSFFKILEENRVILSQQKRKEIVLEKIKKIEEESSIKVDIDAELLEEVVAITEFPTPLLGSIDESFLRLPKEVIATSMKEHQRYFACYKGAEISPNFVVVSNADCEDFSLVIRGNERVLRARLNDALFFWDNDIKNGLNPEKLKSVLFIKGFGTLYDKSQREIEIGRKVLANISEEFLRAFGKDKTEAEVVLSQTLSYAKADLVTEMVYEFTELQGIMGGYYAKTTGLDEKISLAIKEQYLPLGVSSELPSSNLGSLVALSSKLDTIFALFSLGMVPSGNKDPYALRRAALGVLRIVREKHIPLDVAKLLEVLSDNYPNADTKQIEEFLKERVFALYETNPSVINAVLASKEGDLLELMLKIEALISVAKDSDFGENFSTFKRVANISKDIDLEKSLDINTALFEKEEEGRLFSAYESAKHFNSGGYEAKLKKLFSLKPEIDAFFDNVMVNAEDESIRVNRKNLIGSIYKSLKEIADVKEIAI